MSEPSHHGGNLRLASQKYGLRYQDFVDFSTNLNPLGPPVQVLEVIKDNVDKIYSYPDPECTHLKERISSYLGVSEKDVIVTNGASELIYLICAHFARRKVLLVEPGFLEYQDAARAFCLDVAFYFLREDRNFVMDSDDLLNSIRSGSSDVIFICNPNNPTGMMISHDEMVKIVRACEQNGAFLVVDESFVELSEFPGDSIVGLVKRFKNLLIIRSMTKSHGLAGIRLGYGVSNSGLICDLSEKQPAWSVNSLAQLAGETALTDLNYLPVSRELIALERRRIFEGLIGLEIKIYPSNANFILLRFLKNKISPRNFEDYLGYRGIIVRNCSNFIGLRDGFYRIAIRTKDENLRLLAALNGFLHDAF